MATKRRTARPLLAPVSPPAPESVPPADSPAGRLARAQTPSLDALAAIDELRRDLDELELGALAAARLSRWTWAEIGAGVGLSRQAAWKRYGRLVDRVVIVDVCDDHCSHDQGGQGRP